MYTTFHFYALDVLDERQIIENGGAFSAHDRSSMQSFTQAPDNIISQQKEVYGPIIEQICGSRMRSRSLENGQYFVGQHYLIFRWYWINRPMVFQLVGSLDGHGDGSVTLSSAAEAVRHGWQTNMVP